MPEFNILNHIIDYMEATGSTYKTIIITIDQELVDQINNDNGTNYTLDELKKATDKCFAHEWIKPISMGSDRYSQLRITQKGIGVARSKRKSEELKKSRSILKKLSDYIEDHRGLFIVFGFLIALITLAIKLFGGKS